MSTDTSSPPQAVPTTQSSTRYIVGTGLLIAVLGLAAILAPYVTGIGLSFLLGVLLLVGGLSHFVQAFVVSGWTGSLWQIDLAVIYVFAGISLLVNPIVGLTTLTLLLIAYLAVSGLVEVVIGVKTRPDARWGWFVASGVVSIVVAGLLWAGFPSTAEWAIGLLVGIHFLTTGLALVLVGYLGEEIPTTTGEGPAQSSPPSG